MNAETIIFGQENSKNVAYIARKTGIPASTLARYKNGIEDMPLKRFAKVCQAVYLTDEQIVKAVKALYK